MKSYSFWIENAKRFDKCVDYASPISSWTPLMREKDMQIFKVGQRVKDDYLGEGTITGFERFDKFGDETTPSLEDEGTSRILVKLDDPSKWGMGTIQTAYCMRHDLTSLDQ